MSNGKGMIVHLITGLNMSHMNQMSLLVEILMSKLNYLIMQQKLI